MLVKSLEAVRRSIEGPVRCSFRSGSTPSKHTFVSILLIGDASQVKVMSSYGDITHAPFIPDLQDGSQNHLLIQSNHNTAGALPKGSDLDLQSLAQRWKHLDEKYLLIPHWVSCGPLSGRAALKPTFLNKPQSPQKMLEGAGFRLAFKWLQCRHVIKYLRVNLAEIKLFSFFIISSQLQKIAFWSCSYTKKLKNTQAEFSQSNKSFNSD